MKEEEKWRGQQERRKIGHNEQSRRTPKEARIKAESIKRQNRLKKIEDYKAILFTQMKKWLFLVGKCVMRT